MQDHERTDLHFYCFILIHCYYNYERQLMLQLYLLIDFSKIGHLFLLKDLFSDVIIANEVEGELIAGEEMITGELDIKDAINGWLNVKA
ncbi:MAG: hypothetical protein DWB56_08010 [Candidatus Jettenia sp.]|nr:hypothetical protein [Candidatus Jettenia sp. AMX1]MBC6928890.1 hypothetical protein [Candidatus Jettenia sp.]KAA0250866.1 MAG: hypothetical protein EDM77_03405 [Candidatus Jettenia sp. AMX1]MCE7879891.1 hypothetical protein [Candidatus Jettenia sp. AMX1]MCQ3926670.1 hypothetical protein [Candidatus Jettenia sp.]MDL1938430.1 hypothetical protein [Candidatus Jettenia sp. AMX1]